MNERGTDTESAEVVARALLLELTGKAWERGTDAERRLALRAAEEQWYREQAEARLRAYGDAAQCHGLG